ncbi:uncharacterized protein V1518DRAFT_423740 [Limtongia smithiae]|uniref:uncharacterized protein n=1 Tax=Limtongia smithiae TaxID=1125753 RepID=UPI0034CF90B9
MSSSRTTTIAPNNSTAVPAKTVRALVMFTAAMVIAPLFSFYFTSSFIFNGNRQWAGLTAAIVANIVVVGYVVFAWKEDGLLYKPGQEEESKKSK